ncbi:MAG TPA: flippase [Candidatus Saccharimonadia bacterium]|nr:flippase [Candidatus Saccharimonadia bacterium]
MSTTQNHKSVARNSAYIFISQLVAAVFVFVSSVYLARAVGPYTMGRYTYLIWIVSTFFTLGSLGIPTAIIKFIAQHSEDKDNNTAKQIAGSWLLISLGLSVIMALILCILAKFHVLTNHDKTLYFYLISLALPLNIIASSLSSIFGGHRRFLPLIKIGVICSPLSFLILVVVLSRSHSLFSIIIAYLLGSILSFCITLIFVRKQDFISFARLPRPVMGPMVKYAITVSAILILDLVVWDRSEVLFLGHYSSPQQVAYYSLSYTFTANIMGLLPGSISGALMPHIASLRKAKNQIINSYQTASKYAGLIVGMLIGGGIALAGPFVTMVYGHDYSQMVPVFRILFFSAGWAAIVNVGSTVLQGMGKQNYLLKIGIVLSVVNIVADFIIIPSHGALGAAMANGGTILLGGIIVIYILNSYVGIPFPVWVYVKILGITVASCATILAIISCVGGQDIWTFVLGGIGFTTMYLCLAVLTKLLKLEDILVLSKVITRKLKLS